MFNCFDGVFNSILILRKTTENLIKNSIDFHLKSQFNEANQFFIANNCVVELLYTKMNACPTSDLNACRVDEILIEFETTSFVAFLFQLFKCRQIKQQQ